MQLSSDEIFLRFETQLPTISPTITIEKLKLRETFVAARFAVLGKELAEENEKYKNIKLEKSLWVTRSSISSKQINLKSKSKSFQHRQFRHLKSWRGRKVYKQLQFTIFALGLSLTLSIFPFCIFSVVVTEKFAQSWNFPQVGGEEKVWEKYSQS